MTAAPSQLPHVAHFVMTSENYLFSFEEGRSFRASRCCEGLPVGASLRDIRLDHLSRTVIVIVEHESFAPAVPPGPRIELSWEWTSPPRPPRGSDEAVAVLRRWVNLIDSNRFSVDEAEDVYQAAAALLARLDGGNGATA